MHQLFSGLIHWSFGPKMSFFVQANAPFDGRETYNFIHCLIDQIT